jgi:hypothetical protein
VDTSEQVILDKTPKREARRRRSVEEKRRIVQETLETGASVARVARRHAVDSNQVFYWRSNKYREAVKDGWLFYFFRFFLFLMFCLEQSGAPAKGAPPLAPSTGRRLRPYASDTRFCGCS